MISLGLFLICIIAAYVAWKENKRMKDERNFIVSVGCLTIIATVISIIAGVLSIAYTFWRWYNDTWFWS